MRLLYVHNGNLRAPSANTIQVARMCQAFGDRGAEVTLLYPAYLWGNALGREEVAEFYGASGFALRTLRAPFVPALMHRSGYLPAAKATAYLWEVLRLALAPRERRPDVIYTRCFSAAWFFPRLRRLLPAASRPRVVFEAHELPADAGRGRALLGVDGVVAITRALAADLAGRLHLPAPRLLVAHDGVPDAWLAPPDREAARQRLGLAPGKPLAVYTGRLYPGTCELLFRTAQALAGEAEVLVVGSPPGSWSADAPDLAELRRQAAARGLDPRLLVGPVPAPRVRDYQTAADLLLAPYSGELSWAGYTSPLKLFEYMAAGRPIVASALPVLGEVLEQGSNAWLVPLDDPGGLAAGVRHLLQHPQLAEELARRARQDVEPYTWNRRAGTILDFVAALPEAR